MTPATKIIWKQEDRESPADQARRAIHQAEAALESVWSIWDAQLDVLAHRPDLPKMCGRTITALWTAIQTAQTLVEGYDYYLARCAEAGISPEDAAAAWNMHSSEAFEAELVEAESCGPNALRMIDETILARLGVPPQGETARA
jgi:hypothetical protein